MADPRTRFVVDPALGFEVDETLFRQAGCHHDRPRSDRQPKSCGGCYARLLEALHAIEDGPPEHAQAVASAVLAALRAEGEAKAARTKKR